MSSAASLGIDDYEPLLLVLQDELGVVVPEIQRVSLLDRVQILVDEYGLDTFAALAERIRGNNEIKARLLDVISQRQSSWALSAPVINILRKYVLEQLPKNARVWVVGCGQGQMAYALAMEVAQYEQEAGESKDIQIIATDHSTADIEQAKKAVYTERQLEALKDEYRKLYTAASDNGGDGQIRERITKNLSFSQCSLKEDFSSLGMMDLIICPDVLVYYSNGVKASILGRFAEQLNSGGIFLAGNNQAVVPFSQDFERVEHPAGIFYRKKG